MSICPRCGATFACGMVDNTSGGIGPEPCWCTRLPTLAADALGAAGDLKAMRCWCPDCLQALIAKSAAKKIIPSER
jgi:hypothetical protein